MSDLRVRRHTDGRVAISRNPHIWRVLDEVNRSRWADDGDVSGEGWSELFVAELPEPDGHDPTGRPYWISSGDEWRAPIADSDLARYRADALRVLACVAASEHHRETT